MPVVGDVWGEEVVDEAVRGWSWLGITNDEESGPIDGGTCVGAHVGAGGEADGGDELRSGLVEPVR